MKKKKESCDTFEAIAAIFELLVYVTKKKYIICFRYIVIYYYLHL